MRIVRPCGFGPNDEQKILAATPNGHSAYEPHATRSGSVTVHHPSRKFAGIAFDASVQFYLGVQRSLTRTLMIESAYVRTRGVKYRLSRPFNQPDRVRDVRRNPDLGEGTYLCSCQNTSYHSWQTSLRQQYARNLTFSLHYTWGKALSINGGDTGADFSGDTFNGVQDFFDVRSNRGPSSGDITHRLAASWVYELPAFANWNSRAARHVLGGWQVSGIINARTGLPVYISQNGLISRPDYAGGDPINPNHDRDGVYLNTRAFALVPLGRGGNPIRPGNLGNGAIRGPGRWVLDVALGKTFRFNERLGLQVRAETFNTLNNTPYSGFPASINARTFRVFETFYAAPEMQLNARLSW